MINLKLDCTTPPKILVLGAHCDDIEIGCGGTLIKLLNEHPQSEVYWVVFSSNEIRSVEARNSANEYLKNHTGSTVDINCFRNGFFPYIATEIKEYFESIKVKFNPDIIFTHFSNDKHQDHRTIAELTWNTFRNHFILQYEIPKYDGDLETPNVYSELSENNVNLKTDNLLKYFDSQSNKHWFTKDLFTSLMRLRGMECASKTGYAEGFHANKVIF